MCKGKSPEAKQQSKSGCEGSVQVDETIRGGGVGVGEAETFKCPPNKKQTRHSFPPHEAAPQGNVAKQRGLYKEKHRSLLCGYRCLNNGF